MHKIFLILAAVNNHFGIYFNSLLLDKIAIKCNRERAIINISIAIFTLFTKVSAILLRSMKYNR